MLKCAVHKIQAWKLSGCARAGAVLLLLITSTIQARAFAAAPKGMAGTWKLVGEESEVNNGRFTGKLTGGSGTLIIDESGSFALTLTYPKEAKDSNVKGAIEVRDDKILIVYDDGDWSDDRATLSDDKNTLTLVEVDDPVSWRLVFKLQAAPQPKDLAGTWTLNPDKSEVFNSKNSGKLTGGKGTLICNAKGTFKLILRFPKADEEDAVEGEIEARDGELVMAYDDSDWSDDRALLSADKRTLTLAEEFNEGNWRLVFLRK